MQGHRNNQSAYETYGRPDQYPTSYQYPSSQAIMNRSRRQSYYPSSDFDFGDQYELYERDRLPSMRESFAFQKLRQNELRNLQAGHDQHSINSRSTLPYWACPCGSSGYDHTSGNSLHHHHNRSGPLANDLGPMSYASYSDTPAYHTQEYHGAGTSYPRGGGKTGFSLGESLPRSRIRKNDQLLRSRASTVSSRFCLQNCPQGFSDPSLSSLGMAGLYGNSYAGRPWLNEGMTGRLRRASSGTSLASYGCGY